MRILSAYDETVPPGVPIRYGNGQTLVPIEQLQEVQSRIDEVAGLAKSLLIDEVTGDTPGLDGESEGIVVEHSRLIGRQILRALGGEP
ncbi:hypothetical protein SEA_ANGELIQUE_57 [Gordonia phage Angelique]|nr:hypothetical protein SEA_ANGELIQUE_57 [Gordonia phage Angelique]